jgi:flagellar motor switch protein FliN
MQSRLAGVVEEVASAIGALVNGKAQVNEGMLMPGRQWLAKFDVAGEQQGRCELTVDVVGAEALLRLVGGPEIQVSELAVATMLRNALSHAAQALSSRPGDDRLELTLSTLTPSPQAADRSASAFALAVPGLTAPLCVAASWVTAAASSAKNTKRDAGPEEREDRIDVILDIDLPVVVRFGRTELPIRALTRIGPGSVIDLGRSPDDPVELLVSDRVVAHGEVVIVGGNYGIRILDVASPSDGLRVVEGLR